VGHVGQAEFRPGLLLAERHAALRQGPLRRLFLPAGLVHLSSVLNRREASGSTDHQVRLALACGGEPIGDASDPVRLGNRVPPSRHLVEDQRAAAHQDVQSGGCRPAARLRLPARLRRHGERHLPAGRPHRGVAQRLALGQRPDQQEHVVAARLLHLERCLEGLPCPAHPQQQQGEGVPDGDGLRMARPPDLLADGEGAPVQRFRFGGLALVPVQVPQPDQDEGEIEPLAAGPLLDPAGANQKRPGRLVLPLSHTHVGEETQRNDEGTIIGPQVLLHDPDRLLHEKAPLGPLARLPHREGKTRVLERKPESVRFPGLLLDGDGSFQRGTRAGHVPGQVARCGHVRESERHEGVVRTEVLLPHREHPLLEVHRPGVLPLDVQHARQGQERLGQLQAVRAECGLPDGADPFVGP